MLVLFAIFNFTNNANAASDVKYVNLIDAGKIKYNNTSGIFYSEQTISLEMNKNYTLIASVKFFGTALKNDVEALDGKYIITSNVNGGSNNIFCLDYSNVGLYVAEYRATSDCSIVFNDFLVRGHTSSSIPITSVILYEGTPDDFTGFRDIEYCSGYSKVGDVVNLYSDVENPILISTIQKSISANDNMDGPLDEIELELDEYSNHSGIGIYSIIYSVLDYSDNETTLTIKVHLIDINAPEIFGEDVIEWDAHKGKPTKDDLIKLYTATDSYDGDVSSSIHIASSTLDQYEVGKYTTYSVFLEAMDLSGNVGYKEILITTVDKEKPVLELRDVVVGLSELSVRRLEDLFDEVIVTASDNSGNFTTSVSCEEFYEKVGFSGKFLITVKLKDGNGNETVKTAYITIVDDIKPEFYMKNELLSTYSNTAYSMEEIKDLIAVNLSSNGILYDEILVISCDYINNEDKVGEYSVKYMFSYKGERNYAIGTIKVMEEESSFNPLYLIAILPVVGLAFIISKGKFRKRKKST